MKAVRIHAFGNESALTFDEIPVPAIGDEDVLIRVVAASVNPVDWKIREGHLRDIIPHRLPLTLAGITAWEAIINVGQVSAGQSVLIHAAAGGVGSLAVQLAKWRGAEVIATASAQNADLVTFLGADEVIDYRKESFAEKARGLDLVFDTVGGQVQHDSWATLKPGGMLVSVVDPPPEATALSMGLRSAFVFIQPSALILDQLAGLVDTGQVRPVIGASRLPISSPTDLMPFAARYSATPTLIFLQANGS